MGKLKEQALYTIRSPGTELITLGRKLHSGTSKTKELSFRSEKKKKYKQKQTKRKTEKQAHEKKKNYLCVAFVCLV